MSPTNDQQISSTEQASSGEPNRLPPLNEIEHTLAAHMFPHGEAVNSVTVGRDLVAPASVVLSKLGIRFTTESDARQHRLRFRNAHS